MLNKSTEKPIVLIVCNFYLPGYKSGGGLRTIVHMVERFKEKYDFRLIARDHDGDNVPYNSVKINDWNDVDGTKVFYLSKDKVKLSKLRELIFEVNPQIIYTNSVFSTLTIFLLTLRRLKFINKIPIILAPEGELSDGALQLKAGKKKAFNAFAKTAGLYRDIIWKVTAEPEKFETERFKGSGGEIHIAPNMPSKSIFEDYRQELKPLKTVGRAKMIFLSRYMRKKNFKWLLENLQGIEGHLEIDIIGPLEDEKYWAETQKVIKHLPPNIEVNYRGHILHEEVPATLFEYNFFVLPTLGENFGHVFVEALAVGCPLLISDRTPWTNLESRQIGWDVPLEESAKWVEKINYCISLDNITYTKLSANARSFAADWLADPEIEESTLRVLQIGLKMAQPS
ncbi:MAG: glycosyltransferase family 4 protein [Pyrinomonadaceae bacterium]|nr:glycosyltransferase family 4 protein [Pyrinomonadaceae bacterium]